jgi:hypothetical protein
MVGTVNGNRAYFEAAVRDVAIAVVQYPGWASRLLTHPVQGLALVCTPGLSAPASKYL